jgi:Homeodomain-like domain-containing protein
VTKSADTVAEALRLLDAGLSKAAAARQLGVSRAAVRDWVSRDGDSLVAERRRIGAGDGCHDPLACDFIAKVPPSEYAYLLGLYLGDGCISRGPRGVFRLRISCCSAYPVLMQRCEDALAAVLPASRVGRAASIGCTDVYSYSKHWPCLFPQTGPGMKHERVIALTPWQTTITREHPRNFLAGLFHSDGCRCINRVKTVRSTGVRCYEYPRYFFSNVSRDILQICGDALDEVGVEWRFNNWNSISVAKRASVAVLDEFIGPKT